MNRFSFYSLFILVFCLNGCVGIDTDYPEIKYYSYELEEPVNTDLPINVQIGTVKVAPQFETAGFVYRKGEFEYENDYYNRFLISPSAIIAEQTERFFFSEKGYKQETFELNAKVTELCADFNKTPAQLKMEVIFDIRREGLEYAKEKISRAVELNDNSPEAFMKAVKNAHFQILERLKDVLIKRIKLDK